MTVHRTGRFPVILAVFAAVFLFACGGGGETPDQPTTASIGATAPRPARPAPSGPPVVVMPPPEAPEPVRSSFPLPVEEPETSAADAMALVDEEGDVEPEPAVPGPPLDPSEKVFTNKDLSKYKETMEQFGFRQDKVVVDLSTQHQDGPTVVSSRPSREQMTEAEREKEILEVQSEMHRLNAELEYLNKRIPSLQNPFLPRAQVSEADQSAEAGLDNAERLDRVKQRISETESRLSDVKLRYAELYKSRDPE